MIVKPKYVLRVGEAVVVMLTAVMLVAALWVRLAR